MIIVNFITLLILAYNLSLTSNEDTCIGFGPVIKAEGLEKNYASFYDFIYKRYIVFAGNKQNISMIVLDDNYEDIIRCNKDGVLTCISDPIPIIIPELDGRYKYTFNHKNFEVNKKTIEYSWLYDELQLISRVYILDVEDDTAYQYTFIKGQGLVQIVQKYNASYNSIYTKNIYTRCDGEVFKVTQ